LFRQAQGNKVTRHRIQTNCGKSHSSGNTLTKLKQWNAAKTPIAGLIRSSTIFCVSKFFKKEDLQGKFFCELQL
jgi:hypothetical protein